MSIVVTDLETCLPNAKTRDVFARREDLPEKAGPLEANVADVERVKDPRPFRVVEAEVIFCASGFGVADISSVEIG